MLVRGVGLGFRHIIAALAYLACLPVVGGGLSGCASTQEEFGHLTYAALSPARDFNLTREPIPDQLRYLQNPFGYSSYTPERAVPPVGTPQYCAALAREITDLTSALNANRDRRVGYRREGDGFVARTGNLRDLGVRAATTSFIPFRGVVRELSGAAQLDRNALYASNQGRYRIGYLIGLGRAKRCPGTEALAAQHVLPVPRGLR